jgi:quercetin dioxygenase-like cupin family protein
LFETELFELVVSSGKRYDLTTFLIKTEKIMDAMLNDMRGITIDMAGFVDYAGGSVVSKTLLDKKAGTLTLFSFDQGQGLSEHTSPYDATVLVVDGEATLVIGGKPLSAKTGEMVIMPAGVPHSLRADKRFKMLLVMIREKAAD